MGKVKTDFDFPMDIPLRLDVTVLGPDPRKEPHPETRPKRLVKVCLTCPKFKSHLTRRFSRDPDSKRKSRQVLVCQCYHDYRFHDKTMYQDCAVSSDCPRFMEMEVMRRGKK